MVELTKVLMVESSIGKGIDGDPLRILKQFFTEAGELIGKIDTWKDEQRNEGEYKPVVLPNTGYIVEGKIITSEDYSRHVWKMMHEADIRRGRSEL